ncbi:helix-turn-helix transcriptional regulator [Kosakonia cowanii]|uniref:helix-turn-helix transcriptional regulator n=1 Tax=Kosakonia cowanii TaxID=208223 RepID=UPI0028B00459|nr:helix-turn-helix transcriptional regulator [Kosakonia cowanii]
MQSPLRKLRKSHGMTLSHVAINVQVDPATLSRIERCEQVPSVELAERLALFFQGEISELHILYPSRYPSKDDLGGDADSTVKAAI